jgi:hypothetical protein
LEVELETLHALLLASVQSCLKDGTQVRPDDDLQNPLKALPDDYFRNQLVVDCAAFLRETTVGDFLLEHGEEVRQLVGREVVAQLELLRLEHLGTLAPDAAHAVRIQLEVGGHLQDGVGQEGAETASFLGVFVRSVDGHESKGVVFGNVQQLQLHLRFRVDGAVDHLWVGVDETF